MQSRHFGQSMYWSIRTKLQIEERKRDLALFNLAIDSKLHGCDVVGIRVEDIAPHGFAVLILMALSNFGYVAGHGKKM